MGFLVPLLLSTSLMRVLIKVEWKMGDVPQIHFFHFFWLHVCLYMYVSSVNCVSAILLLQSSLFFRSESQRYALWICSFLSLAATLSASLAVHSLSWVDTPFLSSCHFVPSFSPTVFQCGSVDLSTGWARPRSVEGLDHYPVLGKLL